VDQGGQKFFFSPAKEYFFPFDAMAKKHGLGTVSEN
jgi:hypothetical protein